jgi:hypothetical protein
MMFSRGAICACYPGVHLDGQPTYLSTPTLTSKIRLQVVGFSGSILRRSFFHSDAGQRQLFSV